MDDIVIDKASNLNVSAVVKPPTFERNISTLVKGGGITFAGKMFLSASRLVIAVLLARLLGAEQYGLYNLAISVAALASGLALLGLDSALVRYVAISASRRDEAGLWGALQVGVGISMLLSVVISTGLFALAYPIAEQTFHEPRLAPLLQLASIIVPLLTLSETLAGASRGFKRMEYPAIAQSIAQPVIRLILVVVLAVVGLNAAHAIVIYGLADGCASLIMLFYLNRLFSLKRPLHTARRDTRAILGFSLPLWLSQLMHQFRNNAQTLLLGSFNTVTSVGIFSVASQLNTFGGLFSSSINIASKPIIAELHDRGDREQMGRIYRTTTKWSLMLQLPIFLIVVLFAEPILSVFGESFRTGAAALVVLACADLAHVGTGMGGIILDMTGHTRLKLVNSIIRLILYLGLDVLLIPGWGLMGAAVAVLLGEIAVNLLVLLEAYILFRLLPYDRSTLKPIAASMCAFASTLVLRLWLPAEASLFYVGIHVAVLCAVYGGVTLLLRLSEEERTVLARFYRRAHSMIPRSRPC